MEIRNPESGNGTGTGTRLIDIEGVLMVLMSVNNYML